jgi:hypothetical protein
MPFSEGALPPRELRSRRPPLRGKGAHQMRPPPVDIAETVHIDQDAAQEEGAVCSRMQTSQHWKDAFTNNQVRNMRRHISSETPP